MDDDTRSKEPEDDKMDIILRKSNVLPQRFFNLMEQSKILTQDFQILKAKPVELKLDT
eukprot:CAMPEP_0170510866 /NCGR_PEP_ID=MMETSP0208-20121228/65994_1 /TAXON_ID=197538 /ORGANISM="Strombidium inclinatum, Strain S3" /LENGTH=57 /DNA_ID=CAMNT_0010794357 /DNA_START=3606 /DNA_END=3779 /DNA_ORIENTATION=+